MKETGHLRVDFLEGNWYSCFICISVFVCNCMCVYLYMFLFLCVFFHQLTTASVGWLTSSKVHDSTSEIQILSTRLTGNLALQYHGNSLMTEICEALKTRYKLVYLSFCLPTHLSLGLSICIFTYLLINISIYLER